MIHIKASSHEKEMADEEERKHGDSDSTIFFVHEIVGDSFGLDMQIRILALKRITLSQLI